LGEIPADGRGKHTNRPNKISEELIDFITAIINDMEVEQSHYSSTIKLKNAAVHLKKLADVHFHNNIKFPNY